MVKSDGVLYLKQLELGPMQNFVYLVGDPAARQCVVVDPAWLTWNNGTVGAIARDVSQFASFGDLPILADAMEEAGCTDERILRHLREEEVEHDDRDEALAAAG